MRNTGLKCWCQIKGYLHKFKKGEQDLFLQNIDGLGLFMEIEGIHEQTINDLITIARDFNVLLSDNFQIKKAELIMTQHR